MKRSKQMQSGAKAELLEYGKAAGAGVLVAAGLILGAILLGILLLYGVSFAVTHYDPYLSQKQTVKMVEQYQEELDAYMEAGDFSSLPDIPMLNPGFQRVTAGEGYVEMTCGRTGGDDAHQSWGILYIEDPTVADILVGVRVSCGPGIYFGPRWDIWGI